MAHVVTKLVRPALKDQLTQLVRPALKNQLTSHRKICENLC